MTTHKIVLWKELRSSNKDRTKGSRSDCIHSDMDIMQIIV